MLQQIRQTLPRRLAIAILWLFTVISMVGIHQSTQAQIVNNSSSAETSEDSLTVAVLSLDSIGSPSSADSLFLVIFGGGKTNAAVFTDSGTAAMAGLDTLRITGKTLYYFSRKVSDIDGAGSPGAYSGILVAKTNATGLRSATRFSFQITNWELANIGDSIGIAAQNAKATHDTLDNGFGSLNPVTVGALNTNTITDAAIANGAVNINEFSGDYATAQFEANVFKSSLLDASWKQALWLQDTATVSAGFGQMLKNHANQAGGSGDSASIARWVWNTPAGSHQNAGSFGD